MYFIARLIIGAASSLLTVFFTLDTAKASEVILMSIMPVTILNYIFSVKTDKDPETVGGLIVVSTLISLLILPLILGFVLLYFV